MKRTYTLSCCILIFTFLFCIIYPKVIYYLLKNKEDFVIMANRFILNETSYHGDGAIKEIATEAKARGFKKAFICSDPDLVKFGVTQKVIDVLSENNMEY